MDESIASAIADPRIAHQQEIDRLLNQTAGSLRTSFADYWPGDEHGKNDPCEQNVCLHFGHALLAASFAAYAEAWHGHGGGSSARIDLLALSPTRDWFLAVEVKRLLCNKLSASFEKVLNDVDRLEKFWLNLRHIPELVGHHRIDIVKKYQFGWGLVGGLLWQGASTKSSSGSNTALLESWAMPRTDRGLYVSLLNRLDALQAIRRVLPASSSVHGQYFLLAAFFPLSTRNLASSV